MNAPLTRGASGTPAVPAPAFLTVPEAARMMRTSPVTIYRAIRNGEFPAVRLRGRVIVPTRAIEAMVDAAMTDQSVVDASGWVVVQR